jgi:hypothetical protein
MGLFVKHENASFKGIKILVDDLPSILVQFGIHFAKGSGYVAQLIQYFGTLNIQVFDGNPCKEYLKQLDMGIGRYIEIESIYIAAKNILIHEKKILDGNQVDMLGLQQGQVVDDGEISIVLQGV